LPGGVAVPKNKNKDPLTMGGGLYVNKTKSLSRAQIKEQNKIQSERENSHRLRKGVDSQPPIKSLIDNSPQNGSN